ncbi:unnamed protein product [Boreogadus saida]
MALVTLSLWVLSTLTYASLLPVTANRHAVHWNSSNIHPRRHTFPTAGLQTPPLLVLYESPYELPAFYLSLPVLLIPHSFS